MLTLALALALHGCPQRIQRRRAERRARRSRRCRCSSAAAASPARGAARVGVPRPLGPPPRGRRHDAARDVSRSGRRSTGSTPNPGVRLRYHRLDLRRLVGRGSALADLQHLPPCRLRRGAAVWRRQRGALAGDASPTASSRSSTTTRAPGGAGPRLGDLPARRHRPRDERLRLAARGRTCCASCAGCAPGATIRISAP